ncbi:MAG: hypothetical protein ABS68_00380 [Niastella sp. SCN 39-18]|nr:hypothetical protein [Sphingobacteriales bacterium]ODT55208.1 MAG: hypothetical protein ABS68_00380 [Niastella sp. SCN 39-18]OJW09080.1 MAG: hypothetical protein BGO53_00025 [Sphingobacteriales bacterium 39-19]
MKKFILIVAVVLTGTCYFVSAKVTPPGGGTCPADKDPNCNKGYCTPIYDANGGHTDQCLDPGSSNVEPNCIK